MNSTQTQDLNHSPELNHSSSFSERDLHGLNNPILLAGDYKVLDLSEIPNNLSINIFTKIFIGGLNPMTSNGKQ